MAKIIYLIRHGESEANVSGTYQGQSWNTPLTTVGKKQAQAIAKIMLQLPADAVYTSPLQRTLETATIINQLAKLKLATDQRLMEINHGSWEGKSVRQFDNHELKLLQRWQTQPARVKMIGGETIHQVSRRWLEFTAGLPSGKFIVVTHDLIIRVAVTAAINHSLGQLWQYHLDNCSLTTVSVDPSKLIGLNYNLHLNGLKSDINRQAL